MRPLRIGNFSGFYGDRFTALAEMLAGGEVDVLTGDYLAELTMLILARDRMRNAQLGYAKTFLAQLEDSLIAAIERGVRIVSNAGGLNPAGLAAEVVALGHRLGRSVAVGSVSGDDVREHFPDAVAANAYLGAFGIAECLKAGAQIVVTGRVTDAALTVGPAAAHFGWQREDHDRLAGAMVAGHVLECGTQATGGNYAFFTELSDLRRPGFPIAEIQADGSSTIGKHPGTGGAVTVGTVTAQLLYEIAGPRYAGPDATARFDTIQLSPAGPDRVRITGVRGEPPPPELKVSVTAIEGFRNEMTFVLTGLDLQAKAALVKSQLDWPGAEWTSYGQPDPDADSEFGASMLLQCVVRDLDPAVVGRQFSDRAVQLALASYPGCHLTAPPGPAQPTGVFRAGYLPQDAVGQRAVLPDGTVVEVPVPTETRSLSALAEPAVVGPAPAGPTRRVPLGRVAGARSGDKGGDANLGVWARDQAGFRWLAGYLTVARLRELLPELASLPIERHLLPNLHALNFVVHDLLGRGVAWNARFDPQGKALGEWLRGHSVDVPEALLS